MPVNFHFQKLTTLKNRKLLKQFILSIFLKEKCSLENIDFIFCSNEYLLSINRDFLKHDFYTDIITFDMTEEGKPSISAEVYISVDMVFENAIKYRQSFKTELHRVIFHGILHLCGYKDKSPDQKNLMRKKEEYYLGMFHGEH